MEDDMRNLLIRAEECIGHLQVCGKMPNCEGHRKAEQLRDELIEQGFISETTGKGLPWYKPENTRPDSNEGEKKQYYVKCDECDSKGNYYCANSENPFPDSPHVGIGLRNCEKCQSAGFIPVSSPDLSARVVEKLKEEIKNLLDGDPDNGIRAMGIRTAISIIQSMSQSHEKEGV